MNYLLWIDDERPVNPIYETLQKRNKDKLEIIVFKNALDAMNWLDNYHHDGLDKVYIDLDHDLGSYDFTGYTICKHIVENQIPIAGYAVHSMNPVGAENMMQLMFRYGYRPLVYRTEIVN